MIFDVITRSLNAPQRLVSVEELLGRAEGSRMPEVSPSRLNRDVAETVSSVCPTSALRIVETNGKKLLRFDYGECIGCGRCVEAGKGAFAVAARLHRCGVGRRQLVQHFDFANGTEFLMDSPSPEIVKEEIIHLVGRALNVRQLDAGSCNGCEAEISALTNPYYDLERFGVHFVASPKHADMLLVTGPVTRNMAVAVKQTYEAVPAPKLVVAVGACGCSGGIFAHSHAVVGPLDKVIPVDAYIPGCPPTPSMLLTGILQVLRQASSPR
ncbi:MAG TPA: NADH-quinone oxidoreductase subunit NuoB [Candidatus Limnocylindrales bacterium]|nr:NADH-quinone oxidoreductase subunit NuoB [Candidatus Limnocylindrales bacterium]